MCESPAQWWPISVIRNYHLEFESEFEIEFQSELELKSKSEI